MNTLNTRDRDVLDLKSTIRYVSFLVGPSIFFLFGWLFVPSYQYFENNKMLMFGFWGLFAVLIGLGFVSWIFVFKDCLKRDLSTRTKFVWIVVLGVLPYVAALIYLLAVIPNEFSMSVQRRFNSNS